jgi:hypothetical protein
MTQKELRSRFYIQGWPMTDKRDGTAYSVVITLACIVAAIYLPFTWVLFEDVQALKSDRLGWFLIMPTAIPNLVILRALLGVMSVIISALLESIAVAALTYWARKGGVRRVIAITCAFLVACLFSLAMEVAFNSKPRAEPNGEQSVNTGRGQRHGQDEIKE